MIPLDEDRIEEWFRNYKQKPKNYGEFYEITTSITSRVGGQETLKPKDYYLTEEPVRISNSCFGTCFSYLTKTKEVLNSRSSIFYNKSSACYNIQVEVNRIDTWNAVWMNEEQFHLYLDYLKDHVGIPFTYTIDLDRGKVTITFKYKELKSRNQVKMVMFWLRQAYKYPCSLFTYEAIRLWNRHPEEELYNLIMVPALSTGTRFFSGSNLNFPIDAKMVRLETLQEKLQHSSGKNLSQGYDDKYKPYAILNTFFIGINGTDIIEMPTRTTIAPSRLWEECVWLTQAKATAENWLDTKDRLEKLEKIYQYKLKQGYLD